MLVGVYPPTDRMSILTCKDIPLNKLSEGRLFAYFSSIQTGGVSNSFCLLHLFSTFR
jgi:hypothetical protein